MPSLNRGCMAANPAHEEQQQFQGIRHDHATGSGPLYPVEDFLADVLPKIAVGIEPSRGGREIEPRVGTHARTKPFCLLVIPVAGAASWDDVVTRHVGYVLVVSGSRRCERGKFKVDFYPKFPIGGEGRTTCTPNSTEHSGNTSVSLWLRVRPKARWTMEVCTR
jgi:hypothetical protein